MQAITSHSRKTTPPMHAQDDIKFSMFNLLIPPAKTNVFEGRCEESSAVEQAKAIIATDQEEAEKSGGAFHLFPFLHVGMAFPLREPMRTHMGQIGGAILQGLSCVSDCYPRCPLLNFCHVFGLVFASFRLPTCGVLQPL